MPAAEEKPAFRRQYFAIEARKPGRGDPAERVVPSTLELLVGDITEDDSAAIVNPTNGRLDGGGLVDMAIRRTAGASLSEACRAVARARPSGVLGPGEAAMTPGFKLRAGYVIHCVPPVYARDPGAAPAQLAACCRAIMKLAREQGLSSVALPSIGTGVLGYPGGEAAPIIVATIIDELAEEAVPFRVRIVLFGPAILETYANAASACLRKVATATPRVSPI
jgi:O-acetyl-ADP-ribose deacetylase (regulator of RNase III)